MSEGLNLCSSSKMQPIRDLIAKVAATNTTVLLRGESGVGKEVVAHALHKASPRAGKQFLKVNCAALPSELLESELFGHEKGAFTGAYRQKPGKFEAADGGTLMLDEIGEHQGAAVGRLELPGLLPVGASEGTLFVAEKLRLEQLAGQRRTVHLEELLARSGGRLMQSVGDDLL